jgi:enoyl-CoA hydratase
MIDLDIKQHIATLTLNNPKALNALDKASLFKLGDVLGDLDARDDVRVIILTGAGGTFCSGENLRESSDFDEAGFRDIIYGFQRITRLMRTMRKPLIAAIDGYAMGGGFEIALSCDLRLCTERAKFATPEVNIGQAVTNAASLILARIIGEGLAREMIFTGEMVDAKRAYEIGLVNRVVSVDNLMNESHQLAARIASRSTPAVQASKSLLDDAQNPDIERAMMLEFERIMELYGTEQFKEGVRAFLEKREANFKGSVFSDQ